MAAGRPRGKTLTYDDVVEAAFGIADREGLEALTMRRLGRALGVEAGSLYHHVPHRDALLDALVARLRAQIVPPDPVPADWRELYEAVFGSYATVLAAHPHLVPLAGRSAPGDPEINGLVHLVALGLTVDDATAVWHSLHALVIGFAVLSSRQVALDDAAVLDDALRARYADWRPADLRRALRLVLAGYEIADDEIADDGIADDGIAGYRPPGAPSSGRGGRGGGEDSRA